MVHGQEGQLEAVLPGQLLESGVGFLAVGAVVEDVDDLLALELLQPTLLLAHVADDGRGLAPVRGGEAEDPGEPSPVRGRRHAVAHGEDHDLVDGGLGDELVGDARAVRIHEHGALALQALVAFDALLGVVLRLALLPDDLDAVDAAVTLVEEGEVVHEAVGDGDAARRVGTRPVHEQRNEDSLRLRGHDAGQWSQHESQGQETGQ